MHKLSACSERGPLCRFPRASAETRRQCWLCPGFKHVSRALHFRQIHGAAISHAGAWCKAEEEPAVRVLIAGISMHTLHNNLVVRSVSPTSGDSGIFLVVGYPDRKHLVHVLPWVDLVRALWLGFEVDERNWPGCRAGTWTYRPKVSPQAMSSIVQHNTFLCRVSASSKHTRRSPQHYRERR